jgi:multiple sugar transport system ATP-binding protein
MTVRDTLALPWLPSSQTPESEFTRPNLLPAEPFGSAPKGAKTVGLRHDHIVSGDGKAANVTRVMRLGDQTRLHLRLDGLDIIALPDVHSQLVPAINPQ